jgi:hypothetical protein
MRLSLLLAVAGILAVAASVLAAQGQLAAPTRRDATTLSSAPEIGQRFEPTSESIGSMMAASAQTYPSYYASYNQVDYIIGVDDDQRIAWIQTSDSAFLTPDGLKVGDPLDCVMAATNERIRPELGWAWHVPLPSGWHAMLNRQFRDNEKFELLFPRHDRLDVPDNAVVVAFFKRR